ncbi:MAG: CHASE domain-containing protein [Acidimicrobiia bacterium]
MARYLTVGMIIIVGVVLSAVITAAAQRAADRQVMARLELQSQNIAVTLQESVTTIQLHMEAVAALFRASDEVTQSEYWRFVRDISLEPGMVGVGVLGVATPSELPRFVAEMRETLPNFEIFELDADGNRVAVANRVLHYPVAYFEPYAFENRIHGYDVASYPDRLADITRAVFTGRVSATELAPLPFIGNEGFELFRAVFDTNGELQGIVDVPVRFNEFVAASLPETDAAVVDVTIRDITDLGAQEAARDSISITEHIKVADRIWQIDVAPTPDSPIRAGFGTFWILALGCALTLIAAIAVSARWKRFEAERGLVQVRVDAAAKDEFVATVSHELRTPLTAVLGFAELLRDEAPQLTAVERQEIISAIAQEASDVANIVEDLLVAARADYGTLAIETLPTDLLSQTVRVVDALRLTDAVTIERPAVPAIALADPARVRQIVRNLLTNADEHGGSEIRVTIDETSDLLMLSIIDNGPGISAEHEARIFDPYYNAHTPQGRPGAMGLGLATGRYLARHMGGDLVYRRTERETRFELSLPKVSAMTPEDMAEAPSAPAWRT